MNNRADSLSRAIISLIIFALVFSVVFWTETIQRANAEEQQEQQIEYKDSIEESTPISEVTMYTQVDLNLRKSDSTSSKIICVIPIEKKVTVFDGMGTKDGWSYIKCGSKFGYVKSEYLDVHKPIIKLTRYTTQTLNLREEPNTNCGIKKKLSKGTKITVLKNGSPRKGWYKCKVGNTYGYVRTKYVSSKKPSNKTFLGYYQLTAYAPTGCRTASGTYPCVGRTVAINGVKLGTKVYIKGYGTYTVEDTGGMGYGVIDIYMSSESECIAFGRKYNVPVYVIK